MWLREKGHSIPWWSASACIFIKEVRNRISSHQTQLAAQTDPRKATCCWGGHRKSCKSAHDVAIENKIN